MVSDRMDQSGWSLVMGCCIWVIVSELSSWETLVGGLVSGNISSSSSESFSGGFSGWILTKSGWYCGSLPSFSCSILSICASEYPAHHQSPLMIAVTKQKCLGGISSVCPCFCLGFLSKFLQSLSLCTFMQSVSVLLQVNTVVPVLLPFNC